MAASGIALYRKYRPQSLDDLIGQNHITNILKNAFLSGKLSHAYLFCGPRGTGKTSTARILAKMVNCQKADGEKLPCNTCSCCISITDGSNLDLIEIDAASNRGIDDIRELRDKIKLAPTSAQKKVYIIDEVHMLTNEAFNALLKTLEEPPAHALFILATTESHKIPDTILSRVQRLDFNQATVEDLVQALKRVAEAEKIKAEEEVLKVIARRGDGSFRDTLKVLDQLSSSGSPITLEVIEGLVKGGSFDESVRLLESIVLKNSKLSLEIIQSMVKRGINSKEFTNNLIDYTRMMLFIKHQAAGSVEGELSAEKFKSLSDLSQKFSVQELVRLLELLIESQEKLKVSIIPSLPLEIAVVEASNKFDSPSEVKSNVAISKETVNLGMKPKVLEEVVSPTAQKSSQTSEETKKDSGSDDIHPSADLVKLMDKWTYILETIKPYNYSLEALLRQVKVASCDGGILLLEVPYSFHQRILEAPKSRDLLESVISDVLSKSVKVKTALGKRPVLIEDLANVEVAADDEIVQIAAEIFNSDNSS